MKEKNISVKPRPVIYGAIYARYSSDMQSASSARDQIERIKYLVSKAQVPTRLFQDAEIKIEPKWIHCDEAMTGKIAGRFGYQTILEGIRQKSFHILIVDDLSRLTRSLGNLLGLYDLLKHYDVELVSVTDRVSSADPNARTFFTFKGMVADFGNEAHAGRTIRGLQSRALDNFSTGQKPYGYTSEATKRDLRKGREVLSHFRLLIVPHQAETIRRIYQLYSEGYGKVAIAKIFNKEKVPLLSLRAGSWQIGPIAKVLRNEKYIGRWIYGRYVESRDPETGQRVKKTKPRSQWIVKEREDLRIVPQELWDLVQKRLENNKEARRSSVSGSHKKIFGSFDRIDNRHLLTGIMACPKCHGMITLVSGRREGYYGCLAAYRKGSCEWRTLIRRKRAEAGVMDHLRKEFLSEEKLLHYAAKKFNESINKYLRHAPDKKKDLEKELGNVEKEISNLIGFITKGNASNIDAVSEALKQREDRKLFLKQQLSQISNAEDKTRYLVTPYVVKEQLAKTMAVIEESGDRYSSVLQDLFEGPLVPEDTEGGVFLTGNLNIDRAMANRGSPHCTRVLLAGFEPAVFAVRGRRPRPLDDRSIRFSLNFVERCWPSFSLVNVPSEVRLLVRRRPPSSTRLSKGEQIAVVSENKNPIANI